MYAQIFSTLVEQSQSIVNKYSFGNNLKDIKKMINKTKEYSSNEDEIIKFIEVKTQVNKLKIEVHGLTEEINAIKNEYEFRYSIILRDRVRPIKEKLYIVQYEYREYLGNYLLFIRDKFPLLFFYHYMPYHSPESSLQILYESCSLEISRPVLRTMFQLGLTDESEYLKAKKIVKKRIRKYFVKEKREIKETINLLKNKICDDVVYNCILPYM